MPALLLLRVLERSASRKPALTKFEVARGKWQTDFESVGRPNTGDSPAGRPDEILRQDRLTHRSRCSDEPNKTTPGENGVDDVAVKQWVARSAHDAGRGYTHRSCEREGHFQNSPSYGTELSSPPPTST